VHWKFLQQLSEKQPETFVASISGGRVWGSSGAVITPDGHLIGELSREFGQHRGGNSIFEQLRLHKQTRIPGTTALLATAGSDVYYHWMFDLLPRFSLLKKAGLLERIDHFVLNHSGFRFQTESLQALGINTEKMILSKHHWSFHIAADRLVVPSFPSRLDRVSNESCVFLRDLFGQSASRLSSGKKRRLYISRNRAAARRLLNEDEVLTVLRPLGFEVISLEDLSVASQVEMFSAAECVIAPHGAGLTNLVFCSPGTKVLDLFSPTWVNPCYWTLCETIGLEYYYLLGEGSAPEEPIDPMGKADDIRINSSLLRSTLEMMELQR
jgi:capsular polysaccharide biosynthesis protein